METQFQVKKIVPFIPYNKNVLMWLNNVFLDSSGNVITQLIQVVTDSNGVAATG